MKILVVDDEIIQLKSLRIGLRTEGHTVVTALSANGAIEQVRADPASFDLIITDYLMAGVSGLDLLKAVREEKQFIPVILMTAYGEKKVVIEAMQYQCSGFIEKPFSLEQLLAEIARVKSRKFQNNDIHALNDSLAQIIHQINNPLMSILGNAQIAMDYPQTDPEAIKKRMEKIIAATEKITEINKIIMNHGKAKEVNLPKETVDVKWLLADCLNMFEGLITAKNISLEKEIEEKPLNVSGDMFGLQQVFRNLILNAIEAMDGRVNKVLKVTAEMDDTDSRILVHISDTGCGVPDALKNTFFDSGKTTKQNGSGLGLRVFKDMVEKHEGWLQMSSQKGIGTVITVSLPGAN